MPTLPVLPEITQEQYDHLVVIFTEMAPGLGVGDPASAYIQWVFLQLIGLVRDDAQRKMDSEVEALRQQKRAEMDAMLVGLGVA